MTTTAYIEPGGRLSRAMRRVAGGLAAYTPPGVRVVPGAAGASLEVLHVIGWPETAAAARRIRERGGRYAMIQYCLRTTQRPDTADWLELWAGAECVWSYYDLPELMAEDGVACDGLTFYHAPLGVDRGLFRRLRRDGPSPRRYGLLTSGYVADSECVGECTAAAAAAGRGVFHLGPRLRCHDGARHVTARHDISDAELVMAYNLSDYVAGMRRVEGFELPAAEGLLCGARPLMLDAPHYRRWFGPWAVFVPESEPAELTRSIRAVLEQGPKPLTDSEIEDAARAFDWSRIAAGFWERALGREEAAA